MRFQVQDVPDQKALKLSVLDENDSKPELVGDAVIKLQPAFQAHPSQGYDGWHELKYRGKYAGEVYMEMTFYPAKPSVPKKVRQPPSGSTIDILTSNMSGLGMRPLPPDPSQTTSTSNPRPLPMPSASEPAVPRTRSVSPNVGARSPQPQAQHGPAPVPMSMPRSTSPFSPFSVASAPLPLPNRMPSPSPPKLNCMPSPSSLAMPDDQHLGMPKSHTSPTLPFLGHRALPTVPQPEPPYLYGHIQHPSMDNLRKSIREQPSLPSLPSSMDTYPPQFSPNPIRRSTSSDMFQPPSQMQPPSPYTGPVKPLVLTHRKSVSHDLNAKPSSGKFKVSRKPIQGNVSPVSHSYDETEVSDDRNTFIPFSPDQYSSTPPEPPLKNDADQRLDHRSWAPVPRLKTDKERKKSPAFMDPGAGDYRGEGVWDISRQINDGYGDSVINKMHGKSPAGVSPPSRANPLPRKPPKIPLGMSAQEYEAIEWDPYRQDEDPYVYEWK